jgi:MinD superfamily P-loop ATPase
LLDCDVEEPNAHLFIHGKLRLGEAVSRPCLGRIPFDSVFTQAMIQAQTVFEYNNGSKAGNAVR